MWIFLVFIVILILILYFGWIINSISEIKEKLSNIEELLKNKKI